MRAIAEPVPRHETHTLSSPLAMKKALLMAFGMVAMLLSACGNDEPAMQRPDAYELPDLPVVTDIQTGKKAPLYWTIYEYCYDLEQKGVAGDKMDFTAKQWDEVIDWVARDLKPSGYDMVCTDGFIPMLAKDQSGYMTHYGSMALKDLVAKCKAKGLRLGVYDNPLWVHGSRDTRIQGTNRTFGDILYDKTVKVKNPSCTDEGFWWVVTEKEGAREYIDGFFRHYKDLGVDFIRMDFLSWYEDGHDRGMSQVVGRGYGRDCYARALAYIAQSAKKYGIFTSLVMPHMYNDAELEARYGNMVRIVRDAFTSGWEHTSTQHKGEVFANWPNCMNQFDGFNYWAHLSGRDKVILDGDFLRLNRYATDAERQTAVTLQLMAGGPVAVADQPSTIGGHVGFYTNDELLALRRDGFVGKPLKDRVGQDYETWYGQMTDGSWVVALFNRTDAAATLTADFAQLGIQGAKTVRDLWTHTDEGSATSLAASVPAHGCKVVRLK